MKRIIIGLLSGILFLTACGQSSTPQITPKPDHPTSTPSPLPTATPTQTALPSATPTASITSLPTIPTFTPTFDVSTIVGFTPAPKAECPKENPSIVPEFRIPVMPECFKNDSCIFGGSETEILNYLNQGGSIASVLNRLHKAYRGDYQQYAYKDVTGDSIPDLIFVDFGLIPEMHVLYCLNEKYNVYSYDTRTIGSQDIQVLRLEAVRDMNLDGIPEIILSHNGCSGSGCFGIFTLEWQRNSFQNLSPGVGIFGAKSFTLKDFDNNGTQEIIVTGDIPGNCCEGMMTPWEYLTIVYAWDGSLFSPNYEYFASPSYRFQAIQDADQEVAKGNFDKAFVFYQDAIFSDKLEWWSPERRAYETSPFYFATPETPEPTPLPDTTEYPRLAAYAYYRIMLLHLVQGHELDATTVYNTLQEKFGNDQYGHPYVEMATAFWNAYQSTHKMYDGCAAAIQYAAEHPDISIPLGSDYHGAQSHIYVPADVCPFR